MRVFLIHGLGGAPFTLYPLKWWLERTHEEVICITYAPDQESIEASVRSAHQGLLEHAKPEDGPILLVGHSMGGLVSNRLHAHGWDVRAAVYVASPLGGARIIGQVERWIPPVLADKVRRPSYAELQNKERDPVPPHPYRTISVAWPGTTFDGRVYEDGTRRNWSPSITRGSSLRITVRSWPIHAYGCKSSNCYWK